jgi:Fe2+ or Zn2+ uptake regulation protein
MNAIRRGDGAPARALLRRTSYPASLLARDIVDRLTISGVPLSAYDLASDLSADGRRMFVVSIYRALARLCLDRVIERVEMTSRYRVRDVDRAVLMTCTECGQTFAMPAGAQHDALETVLAGAGFVTSKLALEAAGTCLACRDKQGRD